MKYLRLFKAEDVYKEAELVFPTVSLTEVDNNVHFEKNIQFVDLGLPSGTKWMKYNIGAIKESDYGLYFQWGAMQGYAYDSDEAKNNSYWATCPGNDGHSSYDSSAFTEWKKEYLTTNILLNDVDAAYRYTYGTACMPTQGQCVELFKETNVCLVLNDGIEVQGEWDDTSESIVWNTDVSEEVSGCKFINKNDNSKYIFIPTGGSVSEGEFGNVGYSCCLWSSSLDATYDEGAYGLYISTDTSGVFYDSRYNGGNVRGVNVGSHEGGKEYIDLTQYAHYGAENHGMNISTGNQVSQDEWRYLYLDVTEYRGKTLTISLTDASNKFGYGITEYAYTDIGNTFITKAQGTGKTYGITYDEVLIPDTAVTLYVDFLYTGNHQFTPVVKTIIESNL